MLDDLAAFQRTLFSSAAVEPLAATMASGATTFPELTELEQQGKIVFKRSCAACHGGVLHPSGSTADGGIPRPIRMRYQNILTACPRPATDGFVPCPPRLAQRGRVSHHAGER
jgi:mono/diheme cytochrome c family protein